MRVVISQPMFFPWPGMLEQIKLADVFVYYSDVNFSKGSFTNRVQLKVSEGSRWLTIPLKDLHLGQKINQVSIQPFDIWGCKQRTLLQESLGAGRYFADALTVYESVVLSHSSNSLSDLARASMLAIARYFNLHQGVEFVDSCDLGINGSGSERVLNIVKALGGTQYITGHGARNYLEHQRFSDEGIEVEYMNYACARYLQSHGEFTPYVSTLDLIAHCGKEGSHFLQSDTMNWRNFLRNSHE